jgi:hypothetical protein
MPEDSAGIFCSWHCEIEADSWLYREMSAIEFTQPRDANGDPCESP